MSSTPPPIVMRAKQMFKSYKASREADQICKHFLSFFTPIIAESKEELAGAHKIRHEVFCEELKLFETQDDKFEHDRYDEYARQCVIKHQRTNDFAGTVRMIMPVNDDHPLPIETVATEYITDTQYLPSNFKRDEIVEVSRIAIDRKFRRRKHDNFDGAAIGAINEKTYSDIELRCFPLLAVGMYMTAASVCLLKGKKHVYFMVEPRLAKSMKYIGIKLIKIGDDFNYVGRRAPYYISIKDFVAHLSPSFRFMLKTFTKIMD